MKDLDFVSKDSGFVRRIVVEPGNATRYQIVYSMQFSFVALPDFGVAATMSPTPGDHHYVAEKLHLGDEDARCVFEAIRADLTALTGIEAKHFEHMDGTVCTSEVQRPFAQTDGAPTMFICDDHDRRTWPVGGTL